MKQYCRNFKLQYPVQQTLHVLIGALAGFCVTNAPTAWLDVTGWACIATAFLLAGFVWVRQTVEFLEQKDTPGIDLAFYMAGLLAGIGAGVCWWR